MCEAPRRTPSSEAEVDVAVVDDDVVVAVVAVGGWVGGWVEVEVFGWGDLPLPNSVI
jgi:hypothetical protein